MSWYQLIYDLTLFNAASDVGNYPVLYIAQLGQFIGGIGSSVMSNWIAFILFYVVVFEKTFDIIKNYMYILFSSVSIWLPIVIIYSIGGLPDGDSNIYLVHLARRSLYYYERLVSIALNFFMIACILYKNYHVRSKGTSRTPAEIAINTLCRRVMYYPIIQTISRSGYAWYESQYGFDFRVSHAEHNEDRYAALMYAAIITPTSSLGYLIIFLTIEPHAYECFRELFCGIKPAEINHDTSDIRVSNESMRENDSEAIYDTATESFFSWNNLRSSLVNFLAVPSDCDNRSESEIFAIIDDSQFIMNSSIIELNAQQLNNSATPVINIIHDVKLI